MRALIVDGYNLIHAWPALKRVMVDRGLEDARRQLIHALAAYGAQTGAVVTVVFDAHGRVASDASTDVVDGVHVRFGSRGNSADHVIERLAYRAARAGDAADVVVATNDRLQRSMVGSMGVASIGARSLIEELARVGGEMEQRTERMRTEQRHATRLEQHLGGDVVQRLERLRRGEATDPEA